MELQIKGDRFIADYDCKFLTDMDRILKIPYSIMEQRGFNMLFLYDQEAKTCFNGDWSVHPTDEHISMIRIPNEERLLKMDLGQIPKGIAWELPKINVGGDKFFVDAIEQELREVRNPSNRISFKTMSDNITHIALAYDTEKKNVAQGSREEIAHNPAVLHLKLPSLIEMDPQLMREVMKAGAFQARQELERRMKAFEEQWTRHTKTNDTSLNETKKVRQTKTKSRK